MTPDEIRRAVLALPVPARQALVATLDADQRLDERVIDQAAWLTHRLRASLSKRERGMR